MKKIIIIALVTLSVTSLILSCVKKEEQEQFVTVVTGGTGGTYYPVGTIIAALWNEKLGDTGVKSSAQSSGGSIENLSMLQSKEAQVGIAVAGLAADAQRGQKSFETKPYPDVRLITGLWPELSQFVVTQSSGIKSVADIKGKRFSVGAVGSGTESSSLFILKTLAGLEPKADYNDEHLGYAESSAAMQNGQLDGVNMEAGVPTSAVSELTASNTKVSIINFSRAEFDKIRSVNQNYGYFTIPAGTYTGIDVDVNTVGVRSVLITDASVSEELVYSLVKTLYDNYGEIVNSHAAIKKFTKETATENLPPIKLHPGAIKYYEEEGVNIPAEMK